MTVIFFPCPVCVKNGISESEADEMHFVVKGGQVAFDLLCKKCGSIRSAKNRPNPNDRSLLTQKIPTDAFKAGIP